MKMKMPTELRQWFAEQGRLGGQRRARNLSAEARRQIAAGAAVKRWTQKRFGAQNFESLGLPGGQLIDLGLRDYVVGTRSPEALLIDLAAPRLQREGVPVPRPAPGWRNEVPDPHRSLYELLELSAGELAHSRYNALQRQVVSFADALAQTK
jgi:hypothetical protein